MWRYSGSREIVQNPNLAKSCNSKAIPLCCGPMFIMTSGQLQFKSWFLYVAKNYGFKGDAIISSCFISHLCIAIQKLPSKVDSLMLQFNIHDDQWPIIQKLIPLCCQSYDFKGDAIVPSCFISRLCLCNLIFLITKTKYVCVFWLLICCWSVYRNSQVQEKLFKILMRQSYNPKG